ncbi:MAG: Wzz/FepE/Etk N-terminal domain-containing protein [Proteobacteria bacterium]|nr:Wzz/FepE/Etk N-terminal domain-containing protein [Pseudomonadota bacterium]
MAIGTVTPRDQFDKLLAFARRGLRYWWLIAIITMLGGALSALVALRAKPKYVSEARIIYNERISSSLLQGRNVVQRTRNLGNRYRELLLARPQLTKLITELGLVPDIVAKEGIDAAFDEVKLLIKFRVRGTGMFHIEYTSDNPEEAQKVTEFLTEILITEDRRLRQENAKITKEFLVKEKSERSADLAKRQRMLYEFLAEHPEFVQDSARGPAAATGSAIRAAAERDPVVSDPINSDPRLEALLRQRKRIKDGLDAPEPVDVRPQRTPEQRDADQVVREAKAELQRAQRNLENMRSQFQPAHPDVRRARKRVREAEDRVKRAEAAVPPDPPKPSKSDRQALARDLKEVERQIATTRSRIRREKQREQEGKRPKPEARDEEPENWVVARENEYAGLNQAVEEAQRRVEELDTSLSRAEISASQQMAEEGAVLTVIDPASLPVKPRGKGPIFLLAAGIMAFLILGTGLALALALVDDRLYTAGDLEGLGIAPVMVVVPKPTKRKWFRRV